MTEKKKKYSKNEKREPIVEYFGDVTTIYSICGTPVYGFPEGYKGDRDSDYAYLDRVQVGIELCDRCAAKKEAGVDPEEGNWPCARHYPIAHIRGEPGV